MFVAPAAHQNPFAAWRSTSSTSSAQARRGRSKSKDVVGRGSRRKGSKVLRHVEAVGGGFDNAETDVPREAVEGTVPSVLCSRRGLPGQLEVIDGEEWWALASLFTTSHADDHRDLSRTGGTDACVGASGSRA
uniref:Uncharacterized protein n=1 Tax=Pyrodinium bahamense TaxID=73915 RepID=A0A7S0FAM9_9DINO